MLTPECAYLQIGDWLPRSRVNGPGNRFVLWLQGCSVLCAGCCNPEFQPHDAGHTLSVQAVCDMILTTPGIEGVTYSGGEPFEQAESLVMLSRLCQEAGLTVMAYSGLTYEALCCHKNQHIRTLLSLVDVLVDGPFDASCAAPLLWRGSRNQRVRFLTPCYHFSAVEIERETIELEFCIQGETLVMTGIAADEAVRNLTDQLRLPPRS